MISCQEVKHKQGFTIMEILIVVALIALVRATVPLTTNLKTQIFKGQDARRKGDLASLKKVLEDFYNDKNRYPQPSEICSEENPGNPCIICGYIKTPPAFSPYLGKVPCDPQYSVKDYLYQVDDPTNPSLYRIYTKLSMTDDSLIQKVGCQHGCGPDPYQYNYGVSSPNSDLEKNQNYCVNFERLWQNPDCNICKSPSGGDYCNYQRDLFYNATCSLKCIK